MCPLAVPDDSILPYLACRPLRQPLLAVSATASARTRSPSPTCVLLQSCNKICYILKMAERKGFEPLWACTQTVFKTASL